MPFYYIICVLMQELLVYKLLNGFLSRSLYLFVIIFSPFSLLFVLWPLFLFSSFSCILHGLLYPLYTLSLSCSLSIIIIRISFSIALAFAVIFFFVFPFFHCASFFFPHSFLLYFPSHIHQPLHSIFLFYFNLRFNQFFIFSFIISTLYLFLHYIIFFFFFCIYKLSHF